MIEKLIVISLVATTMLIALGKWGVFSWYANWPYRPKWLPNEVCTFCAGFWVAVGLYFAFPLIPAAILIPFASATLIFLVFSIFSRL